MGYYINDPRMRARGKAKFILDNFDAMQLTSVQEAREAFDSGFGVICVIDNLQFEAAGFCYSERELEEFARPDTRTKTWLSMDRVKAEKLSGFNQ